LDDIDWTRGRIHIQRQLQRVYRIGAKDEGPKTELQLSSLKTDQSHRILELPEVTLNALRKHLEPREAEKLLCGSAWQGTGFLFTSRIGTALEPRNVTREFRALLKSAGLPPIRFHDLRHSAVALLIAQGAHAKAIMALVGHSTIMLTMDTYGHLLEVVHRDTATK
jgi:integrase